MRVRFAVEPPPTRFLRAVLVVGYIAGRISYACLLLFIAFLGLAFLVGAADAVLH